MIQRRPNAEPIRQSGAIQLGDDWPGVFIRGDQACGMADVLRRLPDMAAAVQRKYLAEVIELLDSCYEPDALR